MAVDRCIPALSDAAGVHQHPCGGPEPAFGYYNEDYHLLQATNGPKNGIARSTPAGSRWIARGRPSSRLVARAMSEVDACP